MISYIELLASGAAIFLIYQWTSFHRTKSKLEHIPTLGSGWFILTYFDAWKFIFEGHTLIKAGYAKYQRGVFKIPTFTTSSGWLVMISDLGMIEDMRKAPLDVMSFRGASHDVLQSEHLLKDHIRTPPFHIPVARTPMTRAFVSKFGDVSEEIKAACGEWLDAGEDWKPFTLYQALIHVVCRASNRLFVGTPLCQDSEYLRIQEDWTIHLIVSSSILSKVPAFLKPAVAATMLQVRSGIKDIERLLGPTIQSRLDDMKQYGAGWEGKPNDMITWLIEGALPERRNVKDISMKIVFMNASSIHTTSISTTNALFELAARQEYIGPLRAEIEEAISTHGWTKDAMRQMRKLDSFIKESSRFAGTNAISMRRKVLKDFVFSNGVTVPAGITLAVASYSLQTDSEYYDDPTTFRGFRFSEMRDTGSDEFDPLRHQMITLDPTYMIFGYGRNACPGRFFAVNEVKAILAYIITTYDLKLEGDAAEAPVGSWSAGNRGAQKRKLD
ncbi:cytochrome P450 [Ephemerocybe angulata]|uniref:Cytochrome P450 n=1 Tax=Ephemerocybe angulata TaxID=980116 RepID=A0A8H6HP03_9AGAR|nr:cytochrome P450 [Tulosesus angulatus]